MLSYGPDPVVLAGRIGHGRDVDLRSDIDEFLQRVPEERVLLAASFSTAPASWEPGCGVRRVARKLLLCLCRRRASLLNPCTFAFTRHRAILSESLPILELECTWLGLVALMRCTIEGKALNPSSP